MNIKQWYNELSKVQDSINNLSNVSIYTNNGNTFNIEGLSNNIRGLSKEQARLALSTKNLTDEEIKQILIHNQLIASSENIERGLLKRQIADSNLEATERQRLLTELELIPNSESITLETLTQCTAFKELSVEKQNQILSNLGLIESNNSTSVSFGLLTKSILASVKAMLMNPWTWVTAGIFLIPQLTKAFKKYEEQTKKSREKSKEITDSFKQEKSEIEALTNKYEELSSKLKSASLTQEEYNSIKEQLNDVQKNVIDKFGQESDGIDLVNGKYEEQIRLLDDLKTKKAEDYIGENANNINADRDFVYGTNTFGKTGKTWFDMNKYSSSDLDKYSFLNGVSYASNDRLKEAQFAIGLTGTREEVYEQVLEAMRQIRREFGADGGSDEIAKELYSMYSNILNSLDMDKVEESKNNLKTYAEQSVLANEKTRKSYEDLKKATEEYNSALSNGENISEFKTAYEDALSSLNGDIEAAGIKDADLFIDSITNQIESRENQLKDKKDYALSLFNSDAGVRWVDKLNEEDLDLIPLIKKIEIDKAAKLNTEKEFEEWFERIKNTFIIEPKLDVTKPLTSIDSALSSFSDIYDQIHNLDDDLDNITVDATKLTGLDETFGSINSGKSLEEFKRVLTEITSEEDLENYQEKQQQALNNLATAYLDSTDLINQLDESTKDYTVAQLKAMGITNALEFVESRLNKEVKKDIEGLKAFTNAIGDNVKSMKQAIKNGVDYTEYAENIKDALKNILPEELQNVSTDFLVKNLDDIQATINGDIDALYRLREAASKDYILNMDINAPSPEEVLSIQNEINSLIDGFDIDSVDVNTNLNDLPMIQGLNNLVDAGKITRDQMNSILAGIGVEPVVEMETKTVRLPQLGVKATAGRGLGSGLAVGAVGSVASEMQVPKFSYKIGSRGQKANYAKPAATSKGGSGGGGGGGGSSSKDETEETFDWIEVKIKRLEEEISRLDKTATNTYDSWKTRNNALGNEISKVTDEIKLQGDAYKKYMQQANSIKLSEDYKKKVREGKLDIETIKDEDLKKNIQDYQTWYEKAIACKDAQQDLQIQLGELAETRFDNIKKQYEDLISVIEHGADMVDEKISQIEASGYFVSSNYYTAKNTGLIDLEKSKRTQLQKEYDELVKSRDAAVNEKKITQGSEAWYSMTQEINDTAKAIEECNSNLIEYNNTVRQLKWDRFDYLQERISRITDETEFLKDLLDSYELYDDVGKLNDRGMATLGLNAVNYETYMRKARDYAAEMAQIEKELAKDQDNKDLIERYEELSDARRDAISSAEAEKDAVKSLVEEGINRNLSALSELIDKYKDALSSAKD